MTATMKSKKNPFEPARPTLASAFNDVDRASVGLCAGFCRGFSTREMLSPDEREIIKQAAHILTILFKHL